MRTALILSSLLGCALMAGLFFAFSVAVMKALGRLAPGAGVAAMQSINRTILNPVFFAVFFGTAAACIVTGALSISRWSVPGAGHALAGAIVYLAGVLVVTMVVNVPMNEKLAALEPASYEAIDAWAAYLKSWTAFNHARTVSALVATALLAFALHRSPPT